MALICMAVHSTEENKRAEYSIKTIENLFRTVDFNKHTLFISDNGSCAEMHEYYVQVNSLLEMNDLSSDHVIIHLNGENLGTAKAINKGIMIRGIDDFVIKIDDDCIVKPIGWVDEMEEAMLREPSIGILGLKRKDLRQTPWDEDENFRSYPLCLNHEPGQRWIWVEETSDIMGTCTMFSPRLLDKVGSLTQPSKYGFDDTLMSLRSRLAGFRNCFLPHIEIDHIDRADNQYAGEKRQQAHESWEEFKVMYDEFLTGKRDIYVAI